MHEASSSAEEARPRGELLWVHAGNSCTPAPVAALIQRLRTERPELAVLLTHDGSQSPPTNVEAIVVPCPDDRTTPVEAFLDAWRPDAALWLGTPVRPRLLRQARRREIPAILADVAAAQSGPFGLGPEHVVDMFDHVLARSITDAEILRRASAAPRLIEASAALREGPAPPLCDQEALEALMRGNGGRPVWLAIGVTEEELESVAKAHHRASRLSHRLLMVLVPDLPDQGRDMAVHLRRLGWRTGLRSDGDEPTEGADIYVADLADEDSLWYRFAPITFLGGSLHRPGRGRDPMLPAALGSAIVHGPWSENNQPALRRLNGSGAAWKIDGADALGEAVADLLSPELAARMAHAAWQVASDGAEVTDRIITLVVDLLERAP